MKISKSQFFKDFIISNLLSLVCYLLLLSILNIVTEGKLSIMSGAAERYGYNESDISGTTYVILTVILLVFCLAVFIMFYAILFFRLRKNNELKNDFLNYIGVKKFDFVEFKKIYINSSGKRFIILFSIIVAAGMILEATVLPFASFIMTSQTLIFSEILTIIGVFGVLRRVILPIVTIVFNVAAYTIYQMTIVPLVYKGWADERMRVES